MQKRETATFCPADRRAWRQWLKENHHVQHSVWLILYKKESNKPIIAWSEAVEEALCFGWIDSTRKPIDDEKFMQFFSKRKVKGTWSKVNKEKVKQLIATGLMAPAGYASIETAKQNGSWSILDEVEKLTIPSDLDQAFNNKVGSRDFFLSLSKSVKKAILQWLVLAKRPDTRLNRINEIAELAAKKLKPKQFR